MTVVPKWRKLRVNFSGRIDPVLVLLVPALVGRVE